MVAVASNASFRGLRFFPDGVNHATAPPANPRGFTGGGSEELRGGIASVTLAWSAIAWVGSEACGEAGLGTGVSVFRPRKTGGGRSGRSRPAGRDGGGGGV